MYEHYRETLLSPKQFLLRLTQHGVMAVLLLLGSLSLGVLGFRFLSGVDWIDALVNAAMLLGGMGPVGALGDTAGKLFASFFALYAGLVFVLVAGITLAPFLHRMLHRLHLESDSGAEQTDRD